MAPGLDYPARSTPGAEAGPEAETTPQRRRSDNQLRNGRGVKFPDSMAESIKPIRPETRPRGRPAAPPGRSAAPRPARIGTRPPPVVPNPLVARSAAVSYTHLRAHETGRNLVCRLLL